MEFKVTLATMFFLSYGFLWILYAMMLQLFYLVGGIFSSFACHHDSLTACDQHCHTVICNPWGHNEIRAAQKPRMRWLAEYSIWVSARAEIHICFLEMCVLNKLKIWLELLFFQCSYRYTIPNVMAIFGFRIFKFYILTINPLFLCKTKICFG